MIKGFNIETAPLTDKELICLPHVINRLKTAKGERSAVTSDEICRLVPVLNGARVRKLINHIRQNDIIPCLIATSKGYYIAESKREVDDYIESLIGREQSIKAVREAIERQREERFTPTQGSLW